MTTVPTSEDVVFVPGRRPSHDLPVEVFNAILELEDLVRIAAVTPIGVDARAYIQAEVNVGGQRDRVAALILGRPS